MYLYFVDILHFHYFDLDNLMKYKIQSNQQMVHFQSQTGVPDYNAISW